jgi:hypothetical protein
MSSVKDIIKEALKNDHRAHVKRSKTYQKAKAKIQVKKTKEIHDKLVFNLDKMFHERFGYRNRYDNKVTDAISLYEAVISN